MTPQQRRRPTHVVEEEEEEEDSHHHRRRRRAKEKIKRANKLLDLLEIGSLIAGSSNNNNNYKSDRPTTTKDKKRDSRRPSAPSSSGGGGGTTPTTTNHNDHCHGNGLASIFVIIFALLFGFLSALSLSESIKKENDNDNDVDNDMDQWEDSNNGPTAVTMSALAWISILTAVPLSFCAAKEYRRRAQEAELLEQYEPPPNFGRCCMMTAFVLYGLTIVMGCAMLISSTLEVGNGLVPAWVISLLVIGSFSWVFMSFYAETLRCLLQRPSRAPPIQYF